MNRWTEPLKIAISVAVIVLLSTELAATPQNYDPGKAVTSGKDLHELVANTLKARGACRVKFENCDVALSTGAPYLEDNVSYSGSLFGRNSETELRLTWPKQNIEVGIEAQFKDRTGTTDRIAVYTLLNAIEVAPEPHVILILGGPDWNDTTIAKLKEMGARYLAASLANMPNKQVDVMTFGDFAKWAEETIPQN